jgi:predicted kinase
VERLGRILSAGRDVVLDDTLCFRWLRDRYAETARYHAAQFVLIYVSTPLSEIYNARVRNDAVRQRAPIREEVFQAHVSRFEVPADDERPLSYSRDLPLQQWLDRHVTGQDR